MPNPSELERSFAGDGTDLERCRVDPPGCIKHVQMPAMESVNPPERIGPGQACPHCGGDYGFHADTCPVRPPVQLLVEHPAERAAREYNAAVVISRPEVVWLRRRVTDLEDAIRRHRDQQGNDRCWLDDRQLYGALPEGYTPPAEDFCVELERCQQSVRCRHDPATRHVSPQRRIDGLEGLAAAYRQALTVKDQLIAAQAERIAAQAELLSRVAGKP